MHCIAVQWNAPNCNSLFSTSASLTQCSAAEQCSSCLISEEKSMLAKSRIVLLWSHQGFLFSSNYKTSAGKHMWLQHLDFSGNCEGFWYWGLFQRAFGSESYCDNEQRDIVHWPRQCSVLLGWLSYQGQNICQCSAVQTCYLSRQTTRIATRPNMPCVILMTNTTGEQTRNGTTELQKSSHAMLAGWLS